MKSLKKCASVLFLLALLGTTNVKGQVVPLATPPDGLIVASDIPDIPLSTLPSPPEERETDIRNASEGFLYRSRVNNQNRVNMRNDYLTDEECLAIAMYHEARGEGLLGMKAVAYVIYNRTKSPKWPKSICSVVLQPHQFSFTADRNPDNIKQWNVYEQALNLATRLVRGEFLTQPSPVQNATYFHSLARTRKNGYAFKRKLIITIGNHHFFR